MSFVIRSDVFDTVKIRVVLLINAKNRGEGSLPRNHHITGMLFYGW